MAGFIDLSALALLAGYQMNARGMTPMGVQVLGAILNKCVSTGMESGATDGVISHNRYRCTGWETLNSVI